MAPMQIRIRKAFDLLKDQTSISIARVSSAGTPDLEVAILRATSHEEAPSEERYVQAVLHLTSLSRGYVNACVWYIARRLSKTHNWVVAIKALILAHRLLRDGDPAFEKDLMLSRRHGMRALNVLDFRDESHPNGWDFSTFVHAYGLYLDSRLDCSSSGSFGVPPNSNRSISCKGSKYEYSDSVDRRDDHLFPYNIYEKELREKEHSRSFKDMKLVELMDVLPSFQRLLGRVLACKPTGPAKVNRLVNVALYAVIRESFVLYADLQDGLNILRGSFFDMDLENCGRVLGMYNTAAKQMEDLISFYSFCKDLGVCRTAHYPSVQVISKDTLLEMEDYISDGGRRNLERNNPEPLPLSPPKEKAGSINGIDAMPAHAEESRALRLETGVLNTSTEANSTPNTLPVKIDAQTQSSEDLGDKLALAVFSEPQAHVEPKWDPFPEHPTGVSTLTASNSGVTSWELALIESGSDFAKLDGNSLARSTSGTTGWELALIESGSKLSKQNSGSFAGGFDQFLLESLYEQGGRGQNNYLAMGNRGSASAPSSDAVQSSMLTLPSHSVNASSMLANPSGASEAGQFPANVQVSEMQQKQQLLVPEQQNWLQFEPTGIQKDVTNCSTNPFLNPFHPTSPSLTYHKRNPYYI